MARPLVHVMLRPGLAGLQGGGGHQAAGGADSTQRQGKQAGHQEAHPEGGHGVAGSLM